MFPPTDEPIVIDTPKTPNYKKIFLFVGIGILVLFTTLFLSFYDFSSSNKEEVSENEPTETAPEQKNAFINITGRYEGKKVVLTLNITSLSTLDSINYEFDYNANYKGIKSEIIAGKGIYIPKNNFIDFNNEKITKSLVNTKDNTIFIKNDFWTIYKKN